jgi:hypothetical protein
VGREPFPSLTAASDGAPMVGCLPLLRTLEDTYTQFMPLTPEELYLQLGSLVAETPDLANAPITAEMNRWLGRACALVEQVGDVAQTVTIRVATQGLHGILRGANAQTILAIVHASLAKAELDAPARVQGAFIAAGHTLDAYAAVGRVLGTAKSEVFMVDPYADEKAVTDYALLAPDNVSVRLLADALDHKKTLKPAADRWVQQFGQSRAPLEVRLAPAKTLHDRLIVIDRTTVWGLGQSFNKLAERAHTSLIRIDAEAGKLKIAAYAAMWVAATPI